MPTMPTINKTVIHIGSWNKSTPPTSLATHWVETGAESDFAILVESEVPFFGYRSGVLSKNFGVWLDSKSLEKILE